MTRIDVSVEEYLAGEWPANSQLVNGEVIVCDPTFRHQEIVARVFLAVRSWVAAGAARGRAGFGGNWALAPANVYKPDVWWTSPPATPSLDAISSKTPPTLAVEVWSPSTWHLDRGRKRDVYEQAGVAELWLVDTPRERILVSRRTSGSIARLDVDLELGPDDDLTSPLLAGFALRVTDLFTD